MKRFEVFDNDFATFVVDNNYYEDKHEHNIYDVYEMVSMLNELYEENQMLYDFRMVYNALLFNMWHKQTLIKLVNQDDEDLFKVYKSRKHHDGELCFEGEYFIVVAILPTGKQITNHYPMKYWDCFKIPVYDKVKDEYDGHTNKDVFERLLDLI